MLKYCFVLIFVFQSKAWRIKREDNLSFEVCPDSHPFAFHFGQKCCSLKDYTSEATWSVEKCEEGEVIDCPKSSCEDLQSTCIPNLHVSNSNETEEYYSKKEYLEANRPIYLRKNGDKCIWWNKAHRRWWLGQCENVGTSSGNAYLQEDFNCPHGYQSTWRRGDVESFVISGTLRSRKQILDKELMYLQLTWDNKNEFN